MERKTFNQFRFENPNCLRRVSEFTGTSVLQGRFQQSDHLFSMNTLTAALRGQGMLVIVGRRMTFGVAEYDQRIVIHGFTDAEPSADKSIAGH